MVTWYASITVQVKWGDCLYGYVVYMHLLQCRLNGEIVSMVTWYTSITVQVKWGDCLYGYVVYIYYSAG